MFSDLKKGFQVHTLDTNTVPKYELGKVVAVSEPRYLPPQPGQYQAMQTRVVDLTVELTGETKTYTVPESQNVAKAMGITLSTSIDPIMNELNAIKNTSQDIINSVDAHRAKIEACESILEDINPAFKQTPAFPFFPFGKKRIKILYRSAGNRIPVAGLFHITFF